MDFTLLKEPDGFRGNPAETSDSDSVKSRQPQAYWSSINRVAGEVVRTMDEKEGWVIENHDQFQGTLETLLELVKRHPSVTDYCLQKPREAFKLMAYLHTSTAMMILHASDVQRPGLIENFLQIVTDLLDVEKDGEVSIAGTLALDRFLSFERSALLQRIFAKERVDGVLDALKRSGALSQLELKEEDHP